MDDEQIFASIKKHKEMLFSSLSDLGVARILAETAYHQAKAGVRYSADHRKPIERVQMALKKLDKDTVEYINSVSASFGNLDQLQKFTAMLHEAKDILGIKGRKSLILDGAVLNLLRYRLGQGLSISNTLKQSTSSATDDTPSATVAFLHAEILKIDKKITIRQVHDTLKRADFKEKIRDLKLEILELQK